MVNLISSKARNLLLIDIYIVRILSTYSFEIFRNKIYLKYSVLNINKLSYKLKDLFL